MDRHAGSLARSHQAWDHMVGVAVLQRHHLAVVVGGDAAHVVVDGGQDGDGLLVHIHARKDLGRFLDARQALVDNVLAEVGQLEQRVVLLGATATALHNFQRDGARDNVPRCKILGSGRIPFHEALALRVEQDAALTARALCDEAARAVYAGGVELHKLQVLHGQAGARHHGIAVTSACVGRSCREVRASITPGGKDCLVAAEAVKRAVLHAESKHTNTLTFVVHDQVQRKVLNEEDAVVAQRLPVQCVQDGVSRAV
mmetsp:Transcript_40257/g.101331  ORF Transcript_40257/g.101331 Transcript_40257/m.101331 type:complete len:257 (+) Transcript_40257:765-1535(+)